MSQATSDTRCSVRAHFDRGAEEYYQHHSGEESIGQDLRDRYLAALRPYLDPAQERHVLDVACGPGNFSHIVHGIQPGRVTGIDFSPEMVRVARRRYPHISFLVADAHRLPFTSGSFDVAYSFRSLQHVPDPELAIAEMVRVTAPGGHVIVDFVNRANPLGFLREQASRLDRFLFLQASTRRAMERLCRNLAVEIEAFLPVQLLVDSANLRKYCGSPWLRWLRRIMLRGNHVLNGNAFLARHFALRMLLVARKEVDPAP